MATKRKRTRRSGLGAVRSTHSSREVKFASKAIIAADRSMKAAAQGNCMGAFNQLVRATEHAAVSHANKVKRRLDSPGMEEAIEAGEMLEDAHTTFVKACKITRR